MSKKSIIERLRDKTLGMMGIDSQAEEGHVELLKSRLVMHDSFDGDSQVKNSPRGRFRRVNKKLKAPKARKNKKNSQHKFSESELKKLKSEFERNYEHGESTTSVEQSCKLCMSMGDKSLLSNLVESNWIPGILVVTNFRVLFFKVVVDHSQKKILRMSKSRVMETHSRYPILLSAPLCCIFKIEKFGGKNFSSKVYSLMLHMKDLRLIKIGVNPASKNRDMLFKLLNSPMPLEFAFAYKFRLRKDGKMNRARLFDIEREFILRQQVVKCSGKKLEDLMLKFNMKRPKWGSCSGKFRISLINNDFSFCETYPKSFAVPHDMEDEDLQKAAEYRSKNRIPILTWAEKNTGISIFRSSQPKQMKKNPDPDIKLLNSIIKANGYGNRLMIVDMRPKINAVANQFFRGGGYEKSYGNCELHFLNIENIHEMRKCFKSLMELCAKTGGSVQNFNEEMSKTNWLEHIKLNLRAALFCVKCIERKNQSILIHCSDGWDRTSQCAGLTQLLIDPYFRTLEGFVVLIEKDWLHPGHQFQKRIGTGYRDFFTDSDRSPIFLQFIECVRVLLVQHPTAFEFNENFLIKIMDEIYSARFGNFLFDFEREREEEGDIVNTTEDLWNYLLSVTQRKKYENPFFDRTSTKQTIIPDLRYSSIPFWTNYWLRYYKPIDLPFITGDNLSIFHYHNSFKNPDVQLYNVGMKLKKSNDKLKAKSNESILINEKTVNVFQSEIIKMGEEINKLKKENARLKRQVSSYRKK